MGKSKVTKNTTDKLINLIPTDDWAKLEYEMAHSRWENATNLRRGGLVFFTTVQGALISIIGEHLTNLNPSSLALVIFGILVTLFSWSHELRVAKYMSGYQKRALEIEEAFNLRLIKTGSNEAKERKTISNRKLFSFYYFINICAWVSIIIINIFK